MSKCGICRNMHWTWEVWIEIVFKMSMENKRHLPFTKVNVRMCIGLVFYVVFTTHSNSNAHAHIMNFQWKIRTKPPWHHNGVPDHHDKKNHDKKSMHEAIDGLLLNNRIYSHHFFLLLLFCSANAKDIDPSYFSPFWHMFIFILYWTIYHDFSIDGWFLSKEK